MVKLPVYPYQYRPLEIGEGFNTTTIFRPEGSILLSDFIERMGKSKYKDQWSGREPYARDLTRFQEGDWGIQKVRLVSQAPRPLGHPMPLRAIGPTEVFRVQTINGHIDVETADEARKIWQQECRKLELEHAKETQERSRFVDIISTLRRKLHAGAVKSFIVNKVSGKTIDIPPHHWGKEDINEPWRPPCSIRFAPAYQSYGSPTWAQGSVLLYEEQSNISELVSRTGWEQQTKSTEVAEARKSFSVFMVQYGDAWPKSRYLKEIRKSVKNFSERQFDLIWDQDASQDMKKPGRKGKSPTP